VIALDDLSVLDAHGADGADAVTETIRGLEIDRSEDGHGPIRKTRPVSIRSSD
jgi:hypothetical protein